MSTPVEVVKKRVLKIRPMRRWYTQFVNDKMHRRADVFIISFPKAGRTWLRVMVGKVLSEKSNKVFTTELEQLAGDGIPFIYVTHDGSSKPTMPLERDKSKYRNKKVVFMVRDPRDTVVSYYFHCTRRRQYFQGDISSFIRDEGFGIDRIIAFMNIWLHNQHVPAAFLLKRYEDFRLDPHKELKSVLDFIGVEADDELVESGVAFGRFENMRNMEKQGAVKGSRLRSISPGDQEAYKVRRGKVAGYMDYLSSDDLQYVNSRVETMLDPRFGYK